MPALSCVGAALASLSSGALWGHCHSAAAAAAPLSSAVTLLAPPRLSSAGLHWGKIPLCTLDVVGALCSSLLSCAEPCPWEGRSTGVCAAAEFPSFPSLWAQTQSRGRCRAGTPGAGCRSSEISLLSSCGCKSPFSALCAEFLLVFYFQLPGAACASLQSALVTASGCSVIKFLCFVTRIPTLALWMDLPSVNISCDSSVTWLCVLSVSQWCHQLSAC